MRFKQKGLEQFSKAIAAFDFTPEAYSAVEKIPFMKDNVIHGVGMNYLDFLTDEDNLYCLFCTGYQDNNISMTGARRIAIPPRPDGPKKQKNHDDDRENEAFVEWTRFTIKPKK